MERSQVNKNFPNRKIPKVDEKLEIEKRISPFKSGKSPEEIIRNYGNLWCIRLDTMGTCLCVCIEPDFRINCNPYIVMEKTKRRFIIFIILFLLFTVILGLAFWPLIKKLQNPEYRERFSVWVAGLGWKGVLVLFGLQMLQILVAVIPGGPMQLIAGAAYGAWGGLAILETACAAATVIIFFMVRKFGNPFIIRFFGAGVLSSWGFLKDEKKTALVTFILFLIPGMPKDTLTYLAPLTKLSLVQFTLISVVARFPAMFSSTVMGDAVMQGKWLVFLLVFGLTALIGILSIQARDKIIRRLSDRGLKAGSSNDAN